MRLLMLPYHRAKFGLFDAVNQVLKLMIKRVFFGAFGNTGV
jgi:hypothetical protein